MIVTINLDASNPAFAELMSFIAQHGISATIGAETAPAQATAPAPAKKPRKLEATHDIECVWTIDGKSVAYTTADGKYVGETCVRRELNSRIREAGATWNKDARRWEFKSAAAAKKFAESASATVTAEQWQARRDAAAERHAKRASAQ